MHGVIRNIMKKTVKEKIEKYINKSNDKAFVRKEFNNFGQYRQVSIAVADLIKEGKLMRAGLGVFVKSKRSPSLLKRNYGEMITYPLTDATVVGIEALTKLGYTVKVGSLREKNLKGESTQVPINSVVRVKGRISRKIAVGNQVLQYEKNSGLS